MEFCQKSTILFRRQRACIPAFVFCPIFLPLSAKSEQAGVQGAIHQSYHTGNGQGPVLQGQGKNTCMKFLQVCFISF